MTMDWLRIKTIHETVKAAVRDFLSATSGSKINEPADDTIDVKDVTGATSETGLKITPSKDAQPSKPITTNTESGSGAMELLGASTSNYSKPKTFAAEFADNQELGKLSMWITVPKPALLGACSVHSAIPESESSDTLLIFFSGPHGIFDKNQRFFQILTELSLLSLSKQSDYGKKEDPFSNVSASEEWGISPWVGAMIRLNDKIRRLQKAAKGGTLSNEGVIDSLTDISVYAIIARILYEREEEVDAKGH